MAALIYVERLPSSNPDNNETVIIAQHYIFSLGITNKGKVRFGVAYENPEFWEDVYTNEVIIPGRWYLIVGTYDGKKLGAHLFAQYYDRKKEYILQDDEGYFFYSRNSLDFLSKMNPYNFAGSMAECPDCDKANFAGKIDEIAIWDHGMNYKEILISLDPLIDPLKIIPKKPEPIELEDEDIIINELRIVDARGNIKEKRIPVYDEDKIILNRMEIYDKDGSIFYTDYTYNQNKQVTKMEMKTTESEILFSKKEYQMNNANTFFNGIIYENFATEEKYQYEYARDSKGNITNKEEYTINNNKKELNYFEETKYNFYKQPLLTNVYKYDPQGKKYIYKKYEFRYNEWGQLLYMVEYDLEGYILSVSHYFYDALQYYDRIEVWKPVKGIKDFDYYPFKGIFELDHVWIFEYLLKPIKPTDPEAPLMLEKFYYGGTSSTFERVY